MKVLNKRGFMSILVLSCGIVLISQYATAGEKEKVQSAKLPKLIDLGAKKCIPCKKMAPILENLEKDYSDKFVTEFIDVWVKENVTKAKEYKIQSIPTQIFFDKDGKELWRHVGYISKEDILKKWKELGYNFEVKRADTNQNQTRDATKKSFKIEKKKSNPE